MNFKMLTMGAMALAMMTGSALAGAATGTSALIRRRCSPSTQIPA
ncbi:hypothetical protein [Mesorhizobium sp. Root695]